jgi:hypothetical protein
VDSEPGDVGAAFAGDGRIGIVAGRAQTNHAAAAAWSRRDQTLVGGFGQLVE